MESLKTTLKLFEKMPAYYAQVHFADPLILIVLSFHMTIALSFLAARRRPILSLGLLIGLLVLVLNTRQLHILLSTNQPELLKHKLVSMRYFDDEGSFSVFFIALPAFFLAMMGGLCLIGRLLRQICSVKRAEDREETDKKHD